MTRRAFHQLISLPGISAGWQPSTVRPLIRFDKERRTFVLTSGRLRKEIAIGSGDSLQLTFFGWQDGRNWAVPASLWGLDLYRMAGDQPRFGFTVSGRQRFLGYEIKDEAHGLYTLSIQISEPDLGLQYTLYTRAFPGLSLFEQWVEVRNTGSRPVQLERFDPLLLALNLRRDEPCTLTYLQGCQDYGRGRGTGTEVKPFGPYRVRRASVPPDDSVTLLNTAPFYANSRRSTSSSENINWFSIELVPGAEGVFGGLEWSGEWSLTFARVDNELVLHGGVNYFTRTLPPGGTITSPAAFSGIYSGGTDDGIHELHRFLRSHVMPSAKDAHFPWTCYNTWYSWGIGLDEAAMKKEAAVAASLGLECFYLDAGWYAGSPAKGSFGIGLGSWTENRTKFPSGLASFSDHIHGAGMKFGLWVEPERVDRSLVGTPGSGVRPEWMAWRDGAELIDDDGRQQLCLGNSAAVEWVKSRISRAIADYRVDWLKWDHNFFAPCNRPGHGHQPGDGSYAHIQGLYEVFRFLKASFPTLVIENCSGGGNRIDFGILRCAHTTWNSDDTSPSYRVRYQTIGCSYPFPAQYQNSWYVDSEEERVSASTQKRTFDYLFRSRMIGAFGISDRISNWPPQALEAARASIAEVKRMRPILTTGDVHHLLPQPLLWGPGLQPPTQWEAIQYFDRSLNKGVVLCFRANAPGPTQLLLPRGLSPASRYSIESANSGRVESRSGEQLMKSGVTVSLPEKESSEILWINGS